MRTPEIRLVDRNTCNDSIWAKPILFVSSNDFRLEIENFLISGKQLVMNMNKDGSFPIIFCSHKKLEDFFNFTILCEFKALFTFSSICCSNWMNKVNETQLENWYWCGTKASILGNDDGITKSKINKMFLHSTE